ncbi:MAG: YjbH domain-containing protein, partial [Sinomicrobium sp.]|nr:YjbH domain-containing protein [Sinomicrobium sp.]
NAKIGGYLAGDLGGTLGLSKRFKNGVKLDGFIAVTNAADYDIFGSQTHVNHGLRLSLPLGGLHRTLKSAGVTVETHPFGREVGQTLDNPAPLYELSEPLSYSHFIRHWDDIVQK